MRSTVMALPRTDGDAKGVNNATGGGIAPQDTGIPHPRPDGRERIGTRAGAIL